LVPVAILHGVFVVSDDNSRSDREEGGGDVLGLGVSFLHFEAVGVCVELAAVVDVRRVEVHSEVFAEAILDTDLVCAHVKLHHWIVLVEPDLNSRVRAVLLAVVLECELRENWRLEVVNARRASIPTVRL